MQANQSPEAQAVLAVYARMEAAAAKEAARAAWNLKAEEFFSHVR